MSKCSICGDKIGIGLKVKARDGEICPLCARICASAATLSIDEINRLWEANHNRVLRFSTTNELKGFGTMPVTIDDVHKWFYFGREGKVKAEPIINAFDDVEGYEYETVGGKTVTKSKGGISRALVGGALLGPVGAVVGASTSKKETKTVGGVNLLKVTFNSMGGRKTISLSNPPAGLTEFLDHCINEKEETSNVVSQVSSEADELAKWKGLLDQGIISPEEFEQKKKQLLGI